MIDWREKFIATGIHFAVTLVFASIAAAVIFFVWFPAPLDTMVGGTRLFLLVVGCDLVLGPLLSLIAYNSRKTRLALTVDYTVIGICQLAALMYGVYVAAGTRPVYIAFNGDRYEIVCARDVLDKELALAKEPEYRELPWNGPRLVAVNVPPEDQQDALFESLGGNEEHQRPKFFVPLEAKLDVIRAKSKPLKALADKWPASRPLLDAAVADVGMPEDELAWLPVRHLMGFWTAVIRKADGKPVAWVDFDPYG
jgi:hypothetical protein